MLNFIVRNYFIDNISYMKFKFEQSRLEPRESFNELWKLRK